jgi:DNA-binding CsgD family transcriptional regulator
MSNWPGLRGRVSECEALRGLVRNGLAGRSQVLVLRGEAGIGKTALLQFLIEAAADHRVCRAAGAESEMELPFASLHQLCAPFLHALHQLSGPQRDALATTFGLEAGNPPDRFLVGLAVLTLLCDAAEQQPLLCVIDDAQWMDQASTETLEFVARRLGAERVTMVFAVRTSGRQQRLTGLPELVVSGLGRGDAVALLDSVVVGRLDARVRDRLLADAHGNPLALLELSREQSPTGPAMGHSRGARSRTTLISRLEEGFLRQLDALPDQSRQLLLLAAAEPLGDVSLLWRAAQRSGVRPDAAMPAEAGGLLTLRHRVEFRHPLVRSAVYRAASTEARRGVHEALAAATDPAQDPDRRAWHRARAAAGPDEAVAAELERSAGRALGRGGVTAAAAFLEAAANLTPDPVRRAQRSLAAAQAKATAGAFDDALALLAAAEARPLDETESARVQLLHAQISHNSKHGNKALPLLLAAARRLEPVDAKLARETYLDALAAAMFAGRLADGSGSGMRQVAEAMRGVRLPAAPTKPDRLLRGIAVLYTDGYPAAAPGLLDTVRAFGSDDLTIDEAVRFAWLAACAATDLWDDANWDVLTRRHLEAIRAIGALSVLPVALTSRVIYDLYSGDLAEAESLIAESHWVADVTGGQNTMIPYGDVSLSAIRGQAAAEPQFARLLKEITARGEGVGLNMIGWFRSVLFNSLGRYDEALAAARAGAASPLELGPPKWALAELVEAGVRSGNTDEATGALEQLSAFAMASGTETALGVLAGRNALLRTGSAAEDCYQEAIERLRHTTLRVEHSRAQLRYGEWLRREGRRGHARVQLRTAYDTLAAMGVNGFAERARLELAATGEVVRKPTAAPTSDDLTAQEATIARLAAEGLTNPDIGAALYLSPRTVEWHLRKVFIKLGVTTRRQLRQSLPASDPATPPK